MPGASATKALERRGLSLSRAQQRLSLIVCPPCEPQCLISPASMVGQISQRELLNYPNGESVYHLAQVGTTKTYSQQVPRIKQKWMCSEIKTICGGSLIRGWKPVRTKTVVIPALEPTRTFPPGKAVGTGSTFMERETTISKVSRCLELLRQRHEESKN